MLGERIKIARCKRGLSQAEIGKKWVTFQGQRFLNGKTEPTSQKTSIYWHIS